MSDLWMRNVQWVSGVEWSNVHYLLCETVSHIRNVFTGTADEFKPQNVRSIFYALNWRLWWSPILDHCVRHSNHGGSAPSCYVQESVGLHFFQQFWWCICVLSVYTCTRAQISLSVFAPRSLFVAVAQQHSCSLHQPFYKKRNCGHRGGCTPSSTCLLPSVQKNCSTLFFFFLKSSFSSNTAQDPVLICMIFWCSALGDVWRFFFFWGGVLFLLTWTSFLVEDIR